MSLGIIPPAGHYFFSPVGWLSSPGFRGPRFDADPGPIPKSVGVCVQAVRGIYKTRKIRDITRGVGMGAFNRIRGPKSPDFGIMRIREAGGDKLAHRAH